MKRYKVWARSNCLCEHGEEIELDFEDDTPQKDIEAECEDAMNTIISNEFDTGWNLVKS